MNCIDCENLIRWGKDEKNREFFTQCERANPQIRECEWFKNAKRKIKKGKKKNMDELIEELRNEYLYHTKEILKKLDNDGCELGTLIALIEEIIEK